MPPHMKFASPSASIERGNKLGERPVVRQSKIYRELESGNAMKGLLGHDHLAWDATKAQGAFDGQAVYDIDSRSYVSGGGATSSGSPPEYMAKRASFAPGTNGPTRGDGGGGRPAQGGWQQEEQQEVEYPFPGSSASCDLCGSVVDRFYHCSQCREDQGGLFDVCVVCCGAFYLQQGTPALLQQARQFRHPTHDFQRHAMVHVSRDAVAR